MSTLLFVIQQGVVSLKRNWDETQYKSRVNSDEEDDALYKMSRFVWQESDAHTHTPLHFLQVRGVLLRPRTVALIRRDLVRQIVSLFVWRIYEEK